MTGRSRAVVEAELRASRSDLGSAVAALTDVVGQPFGWRRRVRAHPLAVLAAAFALGLWLGGRE